MSAKPAAIPLFADAYLADTMHLSTEEHGAYLLLLMAAWRQDDCCLPNDDRKLARIAGLSVRKWNAIKPTILEFWTVENGSIFQPRLRKERTYVQRRGKINSENASKRWDAQTTENRQGDECERISDRICETDAPPPPPHKKEETDVSSDVRESAETVVAAWNTMAEPLDLAKCNAITAKRMPSFTARAKDTGIPAILQAIERIPGSPFLRGEKGDWGGATIDFLLRPDSVTKILEGKYDDRAKSQQPRSGDGSVDYLLNRIQAGGSG